MGLPGIIFYGTPEFAVTSLERLLQNKFNILAVVTSPDKHAGRGQKILTSAVKDCAVKHDLKILQPVNMKDDSFMAELKQLSPELQIVVAFRMMPEQVWKFPKLGTFNLHASLLPQYRGAAPINWAVINGEKETGVTTFFLRQEIDTGSVIMQEKVYINDSESVGTLYDRLKNIGAELVVKTANAIIKKEYTQKEQDKFFAGELKPAPKLTRKNTKIDFSKGPEEIRNFIRGLTPDPGAHAELNLPESFLSLMIKIHEVETEFREHNKAFGTIDTDHKNYLNVYVKGGLISLKDIHVSGRSKMSIRDFLNGFKLEGNWRMV
ncbi:MAG: methionyl-tRNA formyltransferase [Bacteroidota bacterium]